ncbi:MAG: hypothetical protein KDD89_01705, partial [Anaerolineales bacterium]|nr:hypothetical protein [Anaerolineales bacterium]
MNNLRTVTYCAFSYLFTLCFIGALFFGAIPTAEAADPCMATADDGTTVFSSADSQAVRDAITAATAGDTIKIAGDCVGASGGELAYIDKDLLLQGGYDGTNWNVASDPVTYPTTLDADANGRVIDISGSAVTLDGLILANGDAGSSNGGALNINSSSTVTLTNSTVRESRATSGGGIYNEGTLRITATDILSNTALEDAGGIFNDNGASLSLLSSTVSSNTATIDSAGYAGGVYGLSTVVISDTVFHNNHSTWRGGGLYTLSNSPQLTNVTFTDNSSNRGGGYNPRGSDATITNALFSGNSAVKGGGIYADFGEPNLTNVTFYNNTASGEGGGLYAIESANVTTIQQSTFYSNTAVNGGAIYNTSGSEVLATNVTISGNHADEAGGGAYVQAFFDLRHVTMVSNTAVITGDGIYANTGADVALLSDNIIAYHEDDNCAIGGTGAIFSLDYNLEDADDCGLTQTNDLINTDPLLEPLADNGGDTLTHAFVLGSPAFNSGSSSGTTIDQRGVARPQYGVADRGAYEFDSFSCTTTNSNVSDELGLQTAIFCYNAATSGSYTITFTNGITLTSATSTITNSNSVPLAVVGNGYTLDGNGTQRHFTIEGGEVSFDSLTFVNGYTADDGGSLWLGDDATVSLNGTDFAGNTAVGSGGAIYATGTFTIENSTLSGNTAYSGGAIYGSGNTAVTNSTFTGNTAVSDDGGAIYADDGVTTLENSTLSGNMANDEGGGINSINTLTITHTTIVSNTAGGLGDNLAVKSPSNVTVGQSIIAYSADADENCAFFGASLTDAGDNVVSDSSCDMSNPDSLEDTDPLLEPLADNGGATQTHAFGLDSPALNFVITPTLATDQRGVARPQGSYGDAGAYELEVACPSFPVQVSDALALNEALFCFGGQLSGTHTISFTADITLDQWLLYTENPNAKLVIAGDGYTLSGDNTYPLFDFGYVEVDIRNLTLTEGNAAGDAAGAIFFGDDVIATLDNTHAISNTAEDGGAYFMMPTAVVTITNSTLISNTANSDGGAIYNRGITTIDNITGTLNYAGDDGGVLYNTNFLTITNSLIRENESFDEGGGIHNSDDNMYIISTLVYSNTAGGNGGGINNRDYMEVINSTIAYNNSGQFGGGLRSSSAAYIIVEDSLIMHNEALSDGGGLDISNIGELTNTRILTNTSGTQGGGLWSEDVYMDNVLVQGNIATEGGGIYNNFDLTLLNSTIRDNEATRFGGGMAQCDCGFAYLENNLFANNEAGSSGGGGIHNNGLLDVVNSTFSGNSTASLGGGIYNDELGEVWGGYLTFSGNTAVLGGGFSDAGVFELEHSIITNSTGGDCFPFGGAVSGLNNLIDNEGSCVLDSLGAVTNFDTTLADNGGDTLTHALLTGSNAIDTAVDNGPSTDQRGVARPQIGANDIGAFEYEPDCTNVNNSVGNAFELNLAIACYNQQPSGSHTITLTQNITATSDVTHINNLTATLTLLGEGYTLDGADAYKLLFVDAGVVSIESITLTNGYDNTASGASLALESTAVVTISNSVIQNGESPHGAAVYNNGGQVQLIDTAVQYNNSYGGGNIHNFNNGQLSVSGGTIYSNTGVYSGIYNQLGTIAVDGTRFEAQYDTLANGAAVHNVDIATLNNVTVISNTLNNAPGTITNYGVMTVTNSLVADNITSGAGGGFNNDGLLTIANSTIRGNSTSGAGGGIWSLGALTLTHVTLYGNTAFANAGDALSLGDGSITAMDYTLVDASSSVACSLSGTATLTGTENLVDDTTCGEASIGRVGAPTNVDPNLADNGGETLTHALLAGSNAIDAAVSSTAVEDQRGVTRPQGIASDIGAFEYAPDASLTITVALQGRTGYTGTYTVAFYAPGNVTTPTLTLTETALADGVFTLTGIPADTYTVTIRTQSYLQAVESITLTGGVTAVLNFGTLFAGDANGDNAVNILDLSILAGAYNTTSGQAGYDAQADFNGDGQVNLLDLSLLA